MYTQRWKDRPINSDKAKIQLQFVNMHFYILEISDVIYASADD